MNEVEVLMNQTLEEEPAEPSEKMANRFVAMFLVSELVLRQQLSALQISRDTIILKGIVKLIPIFQVPYKTVVLLMYQMKVSQLPLDSQQRSNIIMLDGYIEHVLEAYNDEKISYTELREYLALANQTPGDFGYPEMTEDDFAKLLEDCDD